MFSFFGYKSRHREVVNRLDYLQSTINQLRHDIRSFSREIRRSTDVERQIMVKLSDLQIKADEELAAIQADTDLVNAVKQVVDNQNAKIDALKAQVDDLIASGGGSEEDLQRLSDTLDAIRAAETSQREVVSAAVIAGTVAEDGGGEGAGTVDQQAAAAGGPVDVDSAATSDAEANAEVTGNAVEEQAVSTSSVPTGGPAGQDDENSPRGG